MKTNLEVAKHKPKFLKYLFEQTVPLKFYKVKGTQK